MVEFGCSRDFAVDSVEDFFADSAYLGFGGVDYAADRFVSEVRFLVFQCYESLLAVVSTLSSMPSFFAMFLFSEWMTRVVLGGFFCRTL